MINRKYDYLIWSIVGGISIIIAVICIFVILNKLEVRESFLLLSIFNLSPIFIFLAISSLLGINSLVNIKKLIREVNKDKHIFEMNHSFPGKISNAYYNHSYRILNFSPLIIEAKFMDYCGTEYLVKSHNIWDRIPGISIKQSTGEMYAVPDTIGIKVYVDPDNYKDYVVVIEQKHKEGTLIDLR